MTRRVALLVTSIGLLVGAALIGAASLPAGTPTLAAAVDTADRLTAQVAVDDVEVLVVSRGARLAALVAWNSPKGWLTVELDETDPDPVAAWTSTVGGSDIPPLTAAYGRGVPAGGKVEVRWGDGSTSVVSVASDGTWLAARAGQTTAEADGEVIVTVNQL
jgi:hypothetical protein